MSRQDDMAKVAAEVVRLADENKALVHKLHTVEHERTLDAKLLDNVTTHWQRKYAELESRLDALRRIVSDWRACPGSDFEYGIETAFNQLVETLERDVERQCPHDDEYALPEIRHDDGTVTHPWKCEDCGRVRNERGIVEEEPGPYTVRDRRLDTCSCAIDFDSDDPKDHYPGCRFRVEFRLSDPPAESTDSEGRVPTAGPQDDCGACYECLKDKTNELGIDIPSTRMILCPVCGNKRCPMATWHWNACTGSNEPGQPGSRYPALPDLKPGELTEKTRQWLRDFPDTVDEMVRDLSGRAIDSLRDDPACPHGFVILAGTCPTCDAEEADGRYYPGRGCTCAARSESECSCPDVDWTPAEVHELRDALRWSWNREMASVEQIEKIEALVRDIEASAQTRQRP